MLELYNSPISTCSQKVRLVLAEKQLEWTDHKLRFAEDEHLSPAYLRLNPNGVVPTLVHDGAVVVDSSVINEYLDDVFEARPLRPADKLGLARMRAWRQYIDEVPTPSVRYPSYNAYFVPWFSQMSQQEFEAYAARRPLRRDFYLKLGRTGFPAPEIDAAIRRLEDTLARMEASLERSRWLAGDAISLADFSILPIVVRMEDLGLEHLWADRAGVRSWYENMKSRPSFAMTYYEGSRALGPAC